MSWRDIPIDDLELSVRSVNCLKTYGYPTLGLLHDLFSQKPKAELLKSIPHFGAKSYREVAEVLHMLEEKGAEQDAVDEWVKNNFYTIKAILRGEAAVVKTWRFE
jgi:DNA-directed RNA polymerase alpha subunit